ncbi:MAG: 6,7-dimethyl-8-ribityllumazine synthase [Planctomycetaceae bacterium]|nr:6,7-dimethyl-8-ribityllumazine synthase [Planctomycetaceae bacterium]
MPRHLEGQPGETKGAVAIVVARYNESITSNLLKGALEALQEHQISDDLISIAWVPGAWEVALAARRFADSGEYLAVIGLAAVIRGETTHDQYINQQVSHSLGQIALESGVPTLFGVLTCNSLEQAISRSGGRVGNKGHECAMAALEMVDLMRQMPPAGNKNSSD